MSQFLFCSQSVPVWRTLSFFHLGWDRKHFRRAHFSALGFTFFQTLTFLAANRPTSSFESSGLTNTPRGVIVSPTNIAVSLLEGELLAEGDLPSVTPQSVISFNEHTSHSPTPALPEDQSSSVIFHHDDKSSEEESVVLQMDSEQSQISTTLDSNSHLRAVYSLFLLPDYNSSINPQVSETTPVEGTTPNTYHAWTDGLNILTHHNKDDHNSSSVPSVFDSKDLGLSDRPTEGSGSGSALDSNELSQDFDEVATVWTDLLLTLVDDTEKESVATETDNDTEGTSRNETETVKRIEEKNSELSGEEEEEIVQRAGNPRVRKVNGGTDDGVQPLRGTAGSDMLKEKEGESEGETVTGKKIYTETSRGAKAESGFRVFNWPGDMSGSGEGSGDRGEDSERKEKKVSDQRQEIKAVAEKESDSEGSKEVGRRDGIKADFPLFGSSEDDSDGEDQNKSLEHSLVGGKLSLKDSSERDSRGKADEAVKREEHGNGGAKQLSEAAVTGERLQQFTRVEGLFFDVAASPALGRLAPVLRLADANKALDKQEEGKCSTSFLSSVSQWQFLYSSHASFLNYHSPDPTYFS